MILLHFVIGLKNRIIILRFHSVTIYAARYFFVVVFFTSFRRLNNAAKRQSAGSVGHGAWGME
jgi:hypothetical protein